MATDKSKKDKKYALITGGTSGIGYELANLFVKDGYDLILVARSTERLDEVSNEFRDMGAGVLPLDKDLFQPEAASEVYEELQRHGIKPEVLVNNAAQG